MQALQVTGSSCYSLGISRCLQDKPVLNTSTALHYLLCIKGEERGKERKGKEKRDSSLLKTEETDDSRS